MGEAKRRRAQGAQGADALRQRIAAGEFGSDRPATGYLLVLDKSTAGRATLAMLREIDALSGLASALASDALRMWLASGLFTFAVLRGGPGSAEQRTLLAATPDLLRRQVLPQAVSRLQAGGGRIGTVVAVDAPLRPAVDAAVARALGAAAPLSGP